MLLIRPIFHLSTLWFSTTCFVGSSSHTAVYVRPSAGVFKLPLSGAAGKWLICTCSSHLVRPPYRHPIQVCASDSTCKFPAICITWCPGCEKQKIRKAAMYKKHFMKHVIVCFLWYFEPSTTAVSLAILRAFCPAFIWFEMRLGCLMRLPPTHLAGRWCLHHASAELEGNFFEQLSSDGNNLLCNF